MSTKALYSIIAIIVIVIISAVVYLQSGKTQEEATSKTVDQAQSQTQPNNQTPDSTSTEPDNSTPGNFSGETDVTDTGVQVYDISFNGTAYVPNKLEIQQGDIVRFKNDSDKDFWPASARHPDHLEYPEFDADKRMAPGSTYEFKFEKTGTWGFHDHITPSAFGSITVK